MIDYVIPFVDDSDAEWIKVFEKYTDDILDGGRWRDWGILKYQIMSVERYMPWVDRIIIVLSIGASQIPKWLDLSNHKIKIVYDYEFMPNELLPVFNSNAIELYFPRIKGLSEQYLTACDDYLLLRPFKQSEFFTKNGKIRLKVEDVALDNNMYGKTVANSVRMVFPDKVKDEGKKVRCLWANHTVTPHIRSINEAFLNEHEDEIYNSLTREREETNLTWLIYPLNMMRLGLLEKSRIKVGVRRLRKNEDISNLELDGDIAVLNDWYEGWDFEIVKEVLEGKLGEMFEGRSKM